MIEEELIFLTGLLIKLYNLLFSNQYEVAPLSFIREFNKPKY